MVLLGTAFIVAVMAFLPWAHWLGYARPLEARAYLPSVRGWVLWSLAIAAIALLLSRAGRLGPNRLLKRWSVTAAELPPRTWAIISAGAMLTVGALLTELLFARNPHLVDSIAQLFQSRIFLAGGLTAPAPEHYEFFGASHIVRRSGDWFSQYPPGHSALLAVGTAIGTPWLINPLLAAGTVLLVFATARQLLDESVARLATVLFLVSPFALFMSASYMNHVSAAFFLALALYGAVRTVRSEHTGAWPWVTGLALAAAALIRPLDAVAWAPVLGLWILWRRGLRTAMLTAVVCMIGILPLLGYNTATTGSPLQFGYTLLWGSEHGLGFHVDPWGEPFTPLKSFALSSLDFLRLNDQLFSLPYPSLVFVLAALLIAARASTTVERREPAVLLTALLLAAPIIYFFYWHRDNYLGPRFLYASLVPTVLLSAAGISWLDRHVGSLRLAFRLFVLIGLLFGVAVDLPARAGTIAGLEPEMKRNPAPEIERAGAEEALVFVKVGWGSRLVSRLWAWDVPASETERTFRAVDGCRIEVALDRADSLARAGAGPPRVREELRRQLEAWRRADLPVASDLLPDASVRVDTTRSLDPVCAREVARDVTGFLLYGTLVWRNDPNLQNGVIYARDHGPERNGFLMARYPERDYYLYAPASRTPGSPASLRRLAPVDVYTHASTEIRSAPAILRPVSNTP